ncbi:MAG: hypothetical protein ABIQ90_11625, partial [Polaromonas sp.]
HHFHGLGDLAGVFHRLDLAAYFLACCHYLAPTLFTSCNALPPAGAAAPAARQSRFRGPCLKELIFTIFSALIGRSQFI